MSRYNHFAECPYDKIIFKDLPIGNEFRKGFHRNGRHAYIICIKTSELEYYEKRSKQQHSFKFVSDDYKLYGLNLNPTTLEQ